MDDPIPLHDGLTAGPGGLTDGAARRDHSGLVQRQQTPCTTKIMMMSTHSPGGASSGVQVKPRWTDGREHGA